MAGWPDPMEATRNDNAQRARLPELLAHPLRLIEELAIAAKRDELPVIGAAILARSITA